MSSFKDIPSSFFFTPAQEWISEVRAALSAMGDFARDYPRSTFVPQARKVVATCEEKLAGTNSTWPSLRWPQEVGGRGAAREGLARTFPRASWCPKRW